MRAEDVPETMLDIAMEAYWHADGGTRGGLRAAIAAVYPMIARAERERCAAILDTMVCDLNTGKLMPAPTRHPDVVRGAFAAAIRALPDA